MSYDWEKIFKNKSDKELYHIFTGKTILNEEAKLFAETELKNRKFKFNNIKRHMILWELEELKKEERRKKSFFYVKPASSKDLLHMLFLGLFITFLSILDLFFNFFESYNYQEKIWTILGVFGVNIFIYILYRIEKINELKKKNRKQDLTRQLKQENTGNNSYTQ